LLSRGRGDGSWVGRLEVPKNKNSNKKIRNHERISTTYERASTYTSPFSRVPACTEACTDSLDQIKQRDVPGQACGSPAGKRCEVTILEGRERREASVSRASDWDRGEAGATGSASQIVVHHTLRQAWNKLVPFQLQQIAKQWSLPHPTFLLQH
jgi:hypothetical protein